MNDLAKLARSALYQGTQAARALRRLPAQSLILRR